MPRTLNQYVLTFALLGCTGDKSAPADSARTAAQASSPATSSTPAPSSGSAPGILFIGTSLTAGYGLEPDSAYPLQVQRIIDSAGLRYAVVNAGVSGETSSALVRRLDWLLRQPFAVVVIETGANDGLRGIPVPTMKSNIEQVIERVREARPQAKIVLAQMEAPPNLGAVYTREFRSVFPDVARKENVLLMPFLLANVAGIRELNQADGIHPNYEGERIVAQNVWKALRPLLQ